MTRRPDGSPGRVSRRRFLQGSSLVGGAAAVAACSATDTELPTEHDVSAPQREPLPPDQRPVAGVYEFFTTAEVRTVDALVARIIPGDEDDPGALEAGVTNYVDAKLARFEAFAEPTYDHGPFAEGYAEGEPPPVGPDVVPVPEDQLFRYGYQSSTTPQDTYRQGLPALDRFARRRFDAPFAQLTADQQDELLEVLDAAGRRSEQSLREGGATQGGGGVQAVSDEEMDAAEEDFEDLDPGAFFDTVREDTVEGMFADPMYGGNRGLVGWMMIGYPGPQRSYSPKEMKQGTRRRHQALELLPPMNPGRPHQHGTEPMQKPQGDVGVH